MRSQSKGIGSADIDASMCHKIRTIPALLHCASHWQDNHGFTGPFALIIRYEWGFRAILLLWNIHQPRLFSLHDIIA